MKQTLKDHTKRFVRAQRNIARAEPLQNMYARPICAELFAESGTEPDIKYLKKCENYLIKEEGFFSDFSGTSALMIKSTLAMSEDPKQKLKDLQDARTIVREHFPRIPDYIPLAAIILSEVEDKDQWDAIAARGQEVYEILKQDHRILTSGGDILFSLLIAKSGKDPENIIATTKKCAEYLKSELNIDPQSFRSLCRVLAMHGGDNAEESCSRFHELYAELQEKGYKYGKGYQSPMLALAALLPYDIDEIADYIIYVDEVLSKQEMYRGIVPKYSKTVRIMHAAMIVSGALRQNEDHPRTSDDVIIAMEITLWTLFGMLFI